MGNNWEMFKLLMWKNWLHLKRDKTQGILQIGVLTCIALLLLFTISVTHNEQKDAQFYKSVSVDSFPENFIPETRKQCSNISFPDISNPACLAKWRVIYAPKSDITTEIMDRVATLLDVFVQAYPSEAEVEKDMLVDSTVRRDTIGAIIFNNLTVSDVVDYTIRLKVDQYWDDQERKTTSNSWKTDCLYNNTNRNAGYTSGPRSKENVDFEPGYYQEGFLTLQRAVDTSIIIQKSAGVAVDDIRNIDVLMQKYPYPEYLKSSFVMRYLFYLIITLSVIVAFTCIVCCGSPRFLKKLYGCDLTMMTCSVKAQDCNIERIKQLVLTHIPTAEFKSNESSELSFNSHYEKLSALYSELEERKEELGIISLKASMTTMDEAFLRLGAKSIGEGNISKSLEHLAQSEKNKGMPVFAQNYKKLSGSALYFQQFKAMFIKRAITSFKSPIRFFVQIIFPIITAIVGCKVAYSGISNRLAIDPLEITLTHYDHPIILREVINHDAEHVHELSDAMMTYITDMSKAASEEAVNITKEIVDIGNAHMSEYSKRHIVGLQILGGYQNPNSTASVLLTGFFNGQPFHSPPQALNAIGNILFKFFAQNSAVGIRVTNHPLPRKLQDETSEMYFAQSSRAVTISIFVSCGMSVLVVVFVSFLSKEQSTNLQFLSGLKAVNYWVATFVWDFINFMILAFFIVMIFVIYDVDGYIDGSSWLYTWFIFLSYAFAVLPFSYIFSFLNDKRAGLFLLVAVKVSAEICAYYIETDIMRSVFYMLFPDYCFADALRLLNLNYEAKKLCNTQIEQQLLSDFNATLGQFCENDGKHNGIGVPIIIMIFQCYVHFSLLYCIQSASTKPSQENQEEDSDVQTKRFIIEKQDINELKDKHHVVVNRLRKVYVRKVAADSSNFSIRPGDSFALLCVNGARKITNFNIKGYSVTKDIYSVGYCQLFDALIDSMTVEETLYMYARIRGIISSQIPQAVQNIMDNVFISKYAKVKTDQLNAGNKRKVSIAIALMGSPDAIYLEEPTRGMEPVDRRSMWKTLAQIRDSGRTLVLISRSMEECEALCTKIVIMDDGKFQCQGTGQHLKTKFAEGYQLRVKIRADPDIDGLADRSNALASLVKATFPGAELKDDHVGYLTFIITGVKWAEIFEVVGLIKENEEIYMIEEFSIHEPDHPGVGVQKPLSDL